MCCTSDNLTQKTTTGKVFLYIVQKFAITQAFSKLWAIFFQQDVSPPHFGTNLFKILHKTFPDQCLARDGPILWTHKPSDLTPLQFMVRSLSENLKVHTRKAYQMIICHVTKAKKRNWMPSGFVQNHTSVTHSELRYLTWNAPTKTKIINVGATGIIPRISTVWRSTKYQDLNLGLYIRLRISV